MGQNRYGIGWEIRAVKQLTALIPPFLTVPTPLGSSRQPSRVVCITADLELQPSQPHCGFEFGLRQWCVVMRGLLLPCEEAERFAGSKRQVKRQDWWRRAIGVSNNHPIFEREDQQQAQQPRARHRAVLLVEYTANTQLIYPAPPYDDACGGSLLFGRTCCYRRRKANHSWY